MVGAQGARHAHPDAVAQSLRDAFAAEVAARLPHLRDARDSDVVRRDVHTLASSAWIVGEQHVGELARAVEEQLANGETPSGLSALVAALEGFVP